MTLPTFSIVTPSLRQLPWLKRCVRSVADQGVECTHLVQDAGSGPELEAWVRAQAGVRLVVEKDEGMYDALNRGFARIEGGIHAYLNCDEQYLPGALRQVAEFFAAHPEVDLLSGDYLILEADGRLRSFHRATPLRRAMIMTDHLYNYSCGLFFRRSLWERIGGFRSDLRDLGDADWVCRALAAGAKAECLGAFTSVFMLTGQNMSQQPNARREEAALRAQAPAWAKLLKRLLREYRHIEKFARGGYDQGAIAYQIYTGEDAKRTDFSERPAQRFRKG